MARRMCEAGPLGPPTTPGPGATVVIATRNRVGDLMETLDRLSELPEAPAVIVLDNGSSDGTVTAVRALDRGAELIALPGNLGAAARNAGARRAATELIAFSDDDSWWAPNALRRAGALFEANPRLGLVAAQVRVEPGRGTDPTSAAMGRSPIVSAMVGPDGKRYRRVLGFLACGVVVRRSAFLAAGGFCGDLVIGSEEALLSIDMARRGWELIYAPDVVAHHRPWNAISAPPGATSAWLLQPLDTWPSATTTPGGRRAHWPAPVT